jgi:hypothetical protein
LFLVTPKNQKVDSPKSDDKEQIQTPIKQLTNTNQKISDDEERIPTPIKQRTNGNQKLNDDEEQIQTPNKQRTNSYNEQKSPSFQSMNDEDAHYRKIFEKLDKDGKLKIGSRPPSSQSRHSRQDQNNQQYPTPPVDPLIGLDDLADQTARSNDQQNQNSFPSTTTENAKNRFKRAYDTNEDDNEDN